MKDREFFAMLALALLSATVTFFGYWPAAVFPVLMFLLIGFQALASAMSAGTAATTEIGAGLQPASATAKPGRPMTIPQLARDGAE